MNILGGDPKLRKSHMKRQIKKTEDPNKGERRRRKNVCGSKRKIGEGERVATSRKPPGKFHV